MGNNRQLDRRVLWGITIVGLLIVVYLRLIPFHLDLSSGPAAVFMRFTWQPLSINDIPVNLLILVPFSFGLAGLLYQSGRSWSRVTWMTVLSVLALSTVIELIQVYIPERVPSLTDIGTNGLSALLGVALYRLSLFGVRRAIVRYASPTNVTAGLAIYAGFIALFTTYLLWSVGLSTWDDSYPLTLGNEFTDVRPWEGEISQVTLLGRDVTPDEAADLLAGNRTHDTLGHYDLTGTAPFADQQGALPPLQWQPDGTEIAANTAGARVGPDQWLSTGAAVQPFNAEARDGSDFTVAGVFAAARERQRGPARIISVSTDAANRNVTLGQQVEALTIRLRTPSSDNNGEKPEMVIPDFFATLDPHHVVLTFDSPLLTVYVDRPDNRYAVSLGPGLALFQSFERSNGWRLEFPANPHLYDYRYWSLVTLPALLAAAILIAIRDAAIGRTVLPDTIEPRD